MCVCDTEDGRNGGEELVSRSRSTHKNTKIQKYKYKIHKCVSAIRKMGGMVLVSSSSEVQGADRPDRSAAPASLSHVLRS